MMLILAYDSYFEKKDSSDSCQKMPKRLSAPKNHDSYKKNECIVVKKVVGNTFFLVIPFNSVYYGDYSMLNLRAYKKITELESYSVFSEKFI